MKKIIVLFSCLVFSIVAISQQRGIKLAQIIAADTSGYCIMTDTAGFQTYVLCDSLPSNFECSELDSCTIFNFGDVDSTGIVNGDVLIWNDITGIWEPGPLPADQTLSVNDNMDGTVDISITNGNTVIVDICDVVASNCNATLNVLQDSIIQFTDNAGVTTLDTIRVDVAAGETLTTLTVDYNAQTFTYTNEASVPVVVDVCRMVDSCETVTELILQNIFPFLLIYINENGDSTQLDFCNNVDSCETVTTFTVLQDTILAYTDENGDTSFDTLDLSFLAETVTTLTTDYDAQTLTYTNEVSTVEVVDVCRLVDSCVTVLLTSISIYQDTILQYIDENGDTTNLNLCPVVDSCETLTVLSLVQDTIIQYIDEDNVTTQIDVCAILDSCGILPPAFGLTVEDSTNYMNAGNTLTEVDKIIVGNGLNLIDTGPVAVVELGGTSNKATGINTYDNGEDHMFEVIDTFVATLGPTAGTYNALITNDTIFFPSFHSGWRFEMYDPTASANRSFGGALHDNAKGPVWLSGATNGANRSYTQIYHDANEMRSTDGSTVHFVNTTTSWAKMSSDLKIILETPEEQAGNVVAGMLFTSVTNTGEGEWMFPSFRLSADSMYVDMGMIPVDTVVFRDMIDSFETLTNLALVQDTIIRYVDENLDTTLINICAIIDSCLTPATLTLLQDSIIQFNDGFGNITNDTIRIGALVAANETLTSMAADYPNSELDYIDENGATTSINMCPFVDSCETVTQVIYNSMNGSYGYVDEDNDTTSFGYALANMGGGNIAVLSGEMDVAGMTIDVCDILHEDPACPAFSVFEGMANDTINVGDTLNFIAGPGISITVTDDSIRFFTTFTNGQSLCDSIAQTCNPTLLVTEDSILTYTDIAGNISVDTIRSGFDGWGTDVFYMSDGVTTSQIDPGETIVFTDNANINYIVSGLTVTGQWIGSIGAMNDVDTTGQQIGDALIYNGVNYVPTAIPLTAAQVCDSVAANCNTSLTPNYVTDSLAFVDNAGVTTNVGMCRFVDSCETVTSLTFSNPNLTYNDEDGTANLVDISAIDTDVSAFSIVLDSINLVEDATTFKIANIDIAPFQTVTDGNTINFTLNAVGDLTGEVLISGDANNLLTTGTDDALLVQETVTTLGTDYPNSELDYTDEAGIVTSLNMCPYVDSCETVTTLVSQSDTTLVYTDEDNATTTIDLCAAYDSCQYRRTASLLLTLKANQTVTGTTDTVLFDSILVESNYAFFGGFIDTVGNTAGQYTLKDGIYMVSLTLLPVIGTSQTMTHEIRAGAGGAISVRPSVQAIESTGTDGFTTTINTMIDATTVDQKVAAVITATTGSPQVSATRSVMTIHRIGL